MATRLGQHPATVSTVEHFLSAVSALGIDNLVVDVNRPELLIMDGRETLYLFDAIGGFESKPHRKSLLNSKPIEVRHPD